MEGGNKSGKHKVINFRHMIDLKKVIKISSNLLLYICRIDPCFKIRNGPCISENLNLKLPIFDINILNPMIYKKYILISI